MNCICFGSVRFFRVEFGAVFLMNNVHEDEPVVFQSRWALCYLRGPISREQISLLMVDKKIDSNVERAGSHLAGR